MIKILVLVFASVASSLNFCHSAVAQSVENNICTSAAANAKVADDPPSAFGYAGISYEIDSKGLYFKSIVAGSPAEKAGLKVDDRLVSFKVLGPKAYQSKSISKAIGLQSK